MISGEFRSARAAASLISSFSRLIVTADRLQGRGRVRVLTPSVRPDDSLSDHELAALMIYLVANTQTVNRLDTNTH